MTLKPTPLNLCATIFFALCTLVPARAQTDTLSSGSITVVDSARMNKGLVTNSLDALSGQAVGVSVSQGASHEATLSSVRVRGTTSITGGNDPLVIIDGVYSDLQTLSSIYPGDIESFSILRNAAETAPYGSRGASGVIDVKTKKGRGAQFHISYDGNVAFESVYKNLDMMSRSQYISTAEKMSLSYTDGGYDTDFLDAIERTGFVQNHHVAFSGGSSSSNYRASIGYMNHNTVIRGKGNNNFTAKVDLSQKAFDDKMSIDMGVFGSSMSNRKIFDEWKLFYSAASQNPTFPDGKNSSGGYDKNTLASQINNPLALLKEKDNDKILNFNTHVGIGYDILSGLTFKVFGAYSYSSDENRIYLPTWVWAQGLARRAEVKDEEWLGNMTLDYSKRFGIHSLHFMILGEYEESKSRGFYTTAQGFNSNDYGFDNLAMGSILPYGGTGSSYDGSRLISAMVQADYGIADAMTLTLNAREDGSSMFGSGNKWGFFPSASVSWNILGTFGSIREDLPWVDKLVLRTGYGLSGSTGGIESYNSLSILDPVGRISWNGTPVTTIGPLVNANPDLKWETQSSFNVGLDMGLFGGRVVATAEYYYTKTRDMLYMYDVPVPPFTFDKLLANIGSMSNQGFEFGIGATPISTKDMSLDINVNLSFQKNKLISLSGTYRGTHLSAAEYSPIGSLNGAGFHGGDNNIVYQVIGESLGVFYLPHCTGLTQNSDGMYEYEIADLDGDGTVDISDGADRYIAGQATPKAILGSNISFRYKDFDISVQANGAFGHKIYNGTSLSYMNMTSFPAYNVLASAPSKNIGDQVATDYWLEDGDYLNIDYITVGWNVPTGRFRYISGLRLSLSVNNVATITGYSGLTPMINSSVVDGTLGIDDKRSYPCYRSYSFGLSVTF
jgi:TonB-linked SusC/RagA family outer membrane protein